ncbi:MAG: ABC-F family ATP-binding cassette domain-containing protein, partial [Chitinophagaceae bacterium]|nr:ABC-F family ATP-binding cassette domain-containing protein [Chitinophagaceae bacterium]
FTPGATVFSTIMETATKTVPDEWEAEEITRELMAKLSLNLDGINEDSLIDSLSGGWKKRAAIARELARKPDLFLLDEPTNHLDVQMVEWLEHYLSQERVTLLLVTHDRYFLDNVCEEIWELDDSIMYVYKGNYENYLEKKSARIESDMASIDKAKNTYRKELEWMRKQPKARTTKSKSRIDAFTDVETKAKKIIEDQRVQLDVKMSRLGGKIVELKKVYKDYGEKQILKGFDYTFKKGERIGVIGKNGAGKSTFLNILQGIEPADNGKVNIGDTVIFGNYSQQGLIVKEDMRVIEFVKNIAEHFPLSGGGTMSASQFLNLFLFPPDQQYTYISKLSGGEKRRLHLLSILFRNPNFLILDEPTNDLDLPTLGVLENFLSDFPGCLLIVSHDRYFMDRLVDHLFVFEGDGIVRDFPGNYPTYRLSLKDKDEPARAAPPAINEEKSVTSTSAVADVEKRKLSYNEKREWDNLQKEIAGLEKEKKIISEKIDSGIHPYNELMKLSERIAEINSLQDQKELRWLELSEIAG